MDAKDIREAAEDAMNTPVTREDMLNVVQGVQIARDMRKQRRGETTERTDEEIEADIMREQLIAQVVGLTLRQAGRKLRSFLSGAYQGGVPGAVAADVRGDVKEILADLAVTVTTRLERTDVRFLDGEVLHEVDERLRRNEDN